MKKIIKLFLLIFILSSCEDLRTKSISVEYTNHNNVNYITIHSNKFKYDYERINIEGHDFLFRTWATRYGYGSDLVHNPNCSCEKR